MSMMRPCLPPEEDIVGDLERALAEGQLHLLYQPKFDLFRQRITGVEALVRWRHPVYGVVPPVAFIPAAERSGLIGPLGEAVLDQACRQSAAWRRQGLVLGVAVNVSPLQLSSDSRLEDAVDRSLAASGLPVDALELEVTESVLMEAAARATLDRLIDRGVGIALDDFGTGYSSLAYLRRLRAQTLKIDKSFIDGVPGSLGDCMLVGSMVRLAHSFGMVVVAEGVESQEQLEALDLVECDLVQGYAVSRPVPPDDVVALAKRDDLPPPFPIFR